MIEPVGLLLISILLSCRRNGAQGGTRTRTDYSTRPSNVRGYQLRHLSWYFQKNYFLAGAFFARELFAGVFISTFEPEVLAAGAVSMFATGAELESTTGAALALASGMAELVLESPAFAGVSIGVSGLLDRTETLPVSAGIASSNADNIKVDAAIIVTFDKTVAVPRGARAELETLLVNKAPASVLPGCKRTAATRIKHDKKKIPYKI